MAQLSQMIYQKAIACGFDDCGIISLEDMRGYRLRFQQRMEQVPQSQQFYQRMIDITQTKERFPWAKSLVICATWLGKYRYPESLRGRYAKSYFLSPKSDKNGEAYQHKQDFIRWFGENGIRCEGGDQFGHGQVGGLRYAAMMAGLGIIRKNNFLYNQQGSYLELDGYVIDQQCRLYQHKNIRPCPEGCTLCQRACPSKTLSALYAMNPTQCVSYCTTFGQGAVPPGLEEGQFQQWIVGCDACQDCCPFNRHDWDTGVDFPGLDQLIELLQPENLLQASDQQLQEKVIPKTVDHIFPDQVETLRVNARRALRNRETDSSKQS